MYQYVTDTPVEEDPGKYLDLHNVSIYVFMISKSEELTDDSY